jgi:hypothetical protein
MHNIQNPSTSTSTLTAVQYDAALALALAHGHNWARWAHPGAAAYDEAMAPALARVQSERAAGAVTLAAINACAWKAQDLGLALPGIDGPSFEGPAVAHTTGTGRLYWRVEPPGTVLIHVWRPGGETPCLAAMVVEGRMFRFTLGTGAEGRHVVALDVALRALGVAEKVRRALYMLVRDGGAVLAEADAYAENGGAQ